MKAVTILTAIALVCVAVPTLAALAPLGELRAYYGMEDSGAVITDGSAYGNDLTIGTDWWLSPGYAYTPNAWGPGAAGNGQAFYSSQNGDINIAGRLDEDVTLAQHNALSLGGTWPDDPHPAFPEAQGWRGTLTMDLWFKYAAGSNTGAQQTLIQRATGGDWGLALCNMDPYDPERPVDPDGNAHLEFQWGEETGDGVNPAVWWGTYEIGTTLTPDVWHHVIVQHDRTDGYETYLTSYIDGVLIDDNVQLMGGGFIYGAITYQNSFVQMGGYWGHDGEMGHNLDGAIDEVYIYYDEVPEPSMLLVLLPALGLLKRRK
jgi:Concanavalin A-like lectin/glucanases superfamily